MEEEIARKPYATSDIFLESRMQIYYYGMLTFGYFQAERYDHKIERAVETLSDFYLCYPECRFLETKSQKYRNIILDSHIIIYRIADKYIEVLDIIHTSSSISKIQNVRKIHINYNKNQNNE